MRTKNLNLKKKIAFIASVAMIASTAAYLPAEVTQNIGGIDVSATVAYDATNGNGVYVENKTDITAAPAAINTVDIFVKINGKYLSVKDKTPGTTTPEYKLTNTPDLNDGDYKPILANNALNTTGNLAAATSDPTGAQAASVIGANYDVIELGAAADALELPYIADASEVELEFVAKKKNVLGKNSVESIVIPLNEYGMGKVAKQHEYVVGKSDTSNYDEDKKEFKDPANKAGSYEIIDLSGLVVSMKNIGNANESITVNGVDVTEIKDGGNTYKDATLSAYYNGNAYNASSNATGYQMQFVSGSNTIEEDDDINATTYGVKKVGNVYAKVIETTLAKAVSPNAVIKINTGVNGNWKASGKGVDGDGVVTVSMDDSKDGFAASELVTMTQGSNKEYYIYVVKNPENVLTDGAKEDFNGAVSFDVAELLSATPSKTTTGTADGTLNSSATFDGDYKIERKIVTEKIGSDDKFVTKYIVYNNAKSDDFDSGDTVDITLASPSATNKFAIAGSTGLESGSTKLTGTTTGEENVITLKLDSAGTGTTEVIEWTHASGETELFEIEFTNEYEIEFDNQWEDNREDVTKDYDGKVSVDGQKVTNPGDVNRPGFDFEGWSTGAATTDYVYSTNNGKDQIETVTVTPNTKLFAQYKGLRYSVDVNANGGYINTAAGSALNTYAFYPGLSAKQATVASYAQIERRTDDFDIVGGTVGSDTINGWKLANGVYNVGYELKGWSTDKNAKEAMTTKELAAAFPGENKTLTVYAVWEANDVTVNFQTLPFNSNGTVETMDGKFYGSNGVQSVWQAAAGSGAKSKFEKAADGYVTLTTGEKVGELPTPQLAGYEFEGWYAAVFNDNLTNVSATKITADTVLDASLFADPASFTGTSGAGASVAAGDNVYFYAKFTPKTYNITFDIGDGLWPTTDFNDGEEGKIPATVSVNQNGFTKTFTYKRADGSVLTWDVISSAVNPKVGDGEYVEFKNWTINGDKKTYADLSAVKKAIEDMDTLEDIVIKANYEEKSQTNSSIFLNANEGAFYTYDISKKDTTTKNPSAYLTNAKLEEFKYNSGITNATTGVTSVTQSYGGVDYTIYMADKKYNVYDTDQTPAPVTTEATYTNVWKAFYNSVAGIRSNYEQNGFTFDRAAAGTKVADKYKIDGSCIEPAVNSGYGVQVARPGYTFTGWYLDKDCTQPYTFNVYPEKGTQTILFAGWKANTTVRYYLAYDIFNGDNSEASDQSTYVKPNNIKSSMKYIRTFMGTAGEKVNAKDLVVKVKDGTGTQAEYTEYVFDPVLSKNLDTTEKELKCEYSVEGLKSGKFEQAQPYTLIEGRFMEKGYENQDPDPENPNPQPVEENLEAATDVKVAGGVVTWKAAEGAASYRYKVIDKNGNVKYAAATVKGTSQTLAVADIPADDYKIAVIAIAKDGKTTKTTEPIEVKAVKTNLTAPTDVKWADGVLTWKASTDAHHYNVKKVYANGNVKYVGGTADATLDLAAESVDFTAYVIAVDANGKTATSTKGAKVAADTKKVLGTVTDAKYDAETNTVSWTAADNAKSYNICKMVNGQKFWVTGVKDTSYKFENKTPAFNYYVVAVAEDGDYTIGTFNAYPTMATDVVVTEGSKNVTWKAAEGVKYYKIGKVSADGKKVVWNNNKFEGTEGTFSFACTAGQKVVVMAVFKHEAKNLQTTRSATVVAAAAKADK